MDACRLSFRYFVSADLMKEASLVRAGTLADQNCQGQCENPLYSRYDPNTEEGIQLRQLSAENGSENSNLNAADSSQADPEVYDTQRPVIYTHIYLGVSPKKVGGIVAVGSILLLALIVALGIALRSKEVGVQMGEFISSCDYKMTILQAK